MTTLADDLLLLLLDDVSGRPRIEGTKLDYGLAGGVLMQLALASRIDAAGPARRATVAVVDAGPAEDEILDDALRRIGKQPRRADNLVAALSKGLRRRLLTRAEQRGQLRHERGRVLGVFPSDRWPAADDRRRRELTGRLREVLVVGRTPDADTAALVALLASVDAAHVVVGVLDRAERKAVRRRAREIGRGAWAADAVRRAVEAVQAAVAAGATAAVTATTVASS
jgi:hypothetical protein